MTRARRFILASLYVCLRLAAADVWPQFRDNQTKSWLAAVDKRTGEPVWCVDRDEKSNWATPFVWVNAQRTGIVTPGSGKTRSYGLDGKLLWELTGASSITIPTPFATPELLYVASGFIMSARQPLRAIRPGGSGDISLKPGQTSNDAVAWCQPGSAGLGEMCLACPASVGGSLILRTQSSLYRLQQPVGP